MKIQNLAVMFLLTLVPLLFSQNINSVFKHKLKVNISPSTAEIEVVDVISGDFVNNKSFVLNSNLIPISKTDGITLEKIDENSKKISDVGMDRDDAGEKESSLETTAWEIIGSNDILNKDLTISYKGKISSEMESSSKEEYQRGFASTSGIIGSMGTYLGGSTYWVPVFENSKLMTYNLTTTLPKGWSNVSQGERIKSEVIGDKHIDTWECDKAQEEIFLIAAKFTEYIHDMNSGIKAMAFLRTPDEALANKYLEVTEQYMEMYQSMLGDYPYSKFALVENFWETGYGMPSFTLLGEKIIRFPFILHSSYPHELLHNWWGNSVYVDFNSGNWCEGITAFMADHLIKEQRGAGEEYRRSTLQKYSNVVNEENDFPLNKFLSRNNAITEAVGYGKAMMTWQMLRRKIGDELFVKGVNLFNKRNKYKVASYSDIRAAMEEVSSLDLKPFFKQWVERVGAPELTIQNIKTDLYAGKNRVNITIEQTQKEDVFDIDIPIHIATEKGIEEFVFNMNERKQSYQIPLKTKPLKLVVDPQYDIFRFLHPSEVPATLTKIWSSKKNLIILPTKVNKTQFKIYSDFAENWKKTDNDEFEIILDNKIKTLPEDKTAWILGFENKFTKKTINKELSKYNSTFSTESIKLNGKKIQKKGNAFVLTLPKEKDISSQNIFIAFDTKEASAGLIRKLPHYGKYSYLAFNGDAPTNIAKGQWQILSSPLVKYFTSKTQNLPVKIERKALAELKPVFSEKIMMATVKYLASEELKGRGIETPEIDITADYIKNQFKAAGLKPISKKDEYYQKFSHAFKDKGKLNLKNVIGIIPGTDPVLKNEPVILSAHYDHLGLGWPDVRKGNEGEIHYGADDNASGVSILIELAKTMAKTSKPKRTIVFLACTAEESGLIGSRYFVANIKNYFKGDIFANINLDTNGSLFDKKLLVLNGNTAKEWKFIFMGTDYTTGIKTDVISQDLDASDQVAFIEYGIPAVQLFTGPTTNYHKPTDTFEKIDGKGLVKVAIVTKEVINYLANRVDAMPFTGVAKHQLNKKKSSNKSSSKKGGRRVSTGSIPDFAFRGNGVKLSSIIPGSTGEKAGLKTGDIIVELDSKKVTNLKDYSVLLKNYKPKDIVKLKILRDGLEKTIKLVLAER